MGSRVPFARSSARVAALAVISHASRMRKWILSLGFWPSLVIASSSGFIQALGAPPGGWLFGHFVGFVPMLVMVGRPNVDWRAAGGFGLAGGIGVGLAGFPWIAEMLVRFARVPWAVGAFGLLMISLWMAIPYALFAIALRTGPQRGVLSLAWPITAFVALQGIWPNLFPYTPLLGFAERPAFMQLAELGGVPLVEALVVLFALLSARGLMADSGARGLRELGVAASIPPLLLAYGTWRMDALDRTAAGAPFVRVGIVQPNVPVGEVSSGQRMERLSIPSARLERLGAELVVWPEAGAYPYGILRPFRHDRTLGPGRVLDAHRTPTIFGANTREPTARFGFNSVFLLASTGDVIGHYDKINLVPFGESIPLIDPDWVTDRIPQIAHHERGEAPARFVLTGAPVAAERVSPWPLAMGPLICYEDIIPSFVRVVAAQPGGLALFVNVTIDAWYGDSAEPWEHLALAQFRSIEHRIPMVRSVSTGVSAVIDHNGRLVAHLPLRPVSVRTLADHPPESLLYDVVLPRNTETQPTPYARGGWLFLPLCTLIAVTGAGWLGARARLSSRSGRATARAEPPR
jgi:apolipoprotein N-acyltransferase